jgi:hypothetical protein
MPWGIAAGVVGGAVIGGVATNMAAKTQAGAAGDATDAQVQMYNQTREDNASARSLGNSAIAQLGYGIGVPGGGIDQNESNFNPQAYLAANPDVAANKYYSQNPYQHYIDHGQSEGRAFAYTPSAQSQLASLSPSSGSQGGVGLGEFNKKFTLADYQADPGYQFRVDQGKQALERSAAARGGVLSGGMLKDLTDYSQGAASQEYGNAYNRFNQDQSSRFARLATLAGFGSAANNTTASAGQNTANNIGNNIIGAGNATASGYVGGANAINNSIGQGISAYQNQQYLNKIAPKAA